MSNSSRKFRRQFQVIEHVERISYREARKRGAKCLMGILAGLALLVALAFLCVPAHAQSTTNTFNVYSFRASVNPQTVGDMTAAAQSQCNANTAYPCVIIFDPLLSQFPLGNMPAKCLQCIWMDYRTPFSSVSTNERWIIPSGDLGAQIAGAVAAIGLSNPGTIHVEDFGGTATSRIVLGKQHRLTFGMGLYTIAGILCPDSSTDVSAACVVQGAGRSLTKLKMANASNVDGITTPNFATLSGTGNQFGTFGSLLSGFTLDGNKANQSSLATRGTGTPSTVARSAGGLSTIVMTGSTSPAMQAGDTCNVNAISNDSYSFTGRFKAQSGTNATTLVYNQSGQGKSTIGTVAATGSGSVICYSGANGIELIGRNYTIRDVTVANNVLDDVWLDGWTPSFVDDTSQLESTIEGLRTINSNGDGLVFWGPQNTKMWDTVHFQHGQWGREIFQSMIDANSVSYLNTSGSEHLGVGASAIEAASQESSASGGFGILIDNGAGPSTFSGMSVFCIGCPALEWRASGQKFEGQIGAGNGSPTTIGLKLNGGGGSLNAQILNVSTFIDCTSIGVRSTIRITNNDAIGTVGAGNCAAGGQPLGLIPDAKVESQTLGNRLFSIPVNCITNSNGFTPCLPASNQSLPATDVANTWTARQAWNVGVTNSGTGHKHIRTATTCTTAASAGSTCTTASISWPGTAFADTNYTTACSIVNPVNFPVLITVTRSAGSFTATIAAATAAAASYAELDCIADHD